MFSTWTQEAVDICSTSVLALSAGVASSSNVGGLLVRILKKSLEVKKKSRFERLVNESREFSKSNLEVL